MKAKLIIDEIEINVLWFSFGFIREADVNGRPTIKSIFTGLKLIIETQKNLDLIHWAVSNNQTKNIELHIYPVIFGGKTRKLFFYDCHLLDWENEFNSTGSEPLKEMLNISAGGVKDSNSTDEYSTYWRSTFPEQDVEPTVRKEIANEPNHDEQIKVSDKNGSPISDLFYCIAFENEIIASGRTDENGCSKRTELKGVKEKYIYFWGDEAITRNKKS